MTHPATQVLDRLPIHLKAESEAFPPLPKLGRLAQTWRFMRDPFTLVSEARAELGDMFTLDVLGMGKMVFLCSAELLNQLYRLSEEEIEAGSIRYRQLGYLLGRRLSINLDGEEYAERRRLVAPYFSGKKMLGPGAAIRDLVAAEVEKWPVGEPFPLQPVFDHVSLATIVRILFGPLERPSTPRLLAAVGEFITTFRSPAVHMRALQWDLGRATPYGRFVRARQGLYDAFEAEVQGRLDGEEGGDDVLAGLLAGLPAASDPAAREAVVQELTGLLLGGADTTSKVLAWTFVGLFGHDTALERLRREIDEVVGERPIEVEDLARLPYLDAVVQEGLRTHRVGLFAGPRRTKRQVRLGGYTLPPGTIVAQAMHETGRSPRFPHPDRFEPENFLGRDVKLRDWVPFGGGTRACTGMNLAKLELALVIGTIAQRTRIEAGPGSTRPVRVGFTYQPANGTMAVLREKR